MNHDNHMALYEAVYFFDCIFGCDDQNARLLISKDSMIGLGIHESVYTAMMRILVVNDLIDVDGTTFFLSNQQRKKHQHLIKVLINNHHDNHYKDMYDKAVNASQFFFDHISDEAYEIYSRCDFPITFETGQEVGRHLNLKNIKVLELGGNSGGLATALLAKQEALLYTVVDTKIPCRIGKAFSLLHETDITFIESNIFDLVLPSETYDCVILMNLLHDFDDEQCVSILNNCLKYGDQETQFLIIEDVLTSELEPKNMIMQGLRLSVECRGGKQRTQEALSSLFSRINFGLVQTIPISQMQTMLVMGAL